MASTSSQNTLFERCISSFLEGDLEGVWNEVWQDDNRTRDQLGRILIHLSRVSQEDFGCSEIKRVDKLWLSIYRLCQARDVKWVYFRIAFEVCDRRRECYYTLISTPEVGKKGVLTRFKKVCSSGNLSEVEDLVHSPLVDMYTLRGGFKKAWEQMNLDVMEFLVKSTPLTFNSRNITYFRPSSYYPRWTLYHIEDRITVESKLNEILDVLEGKK